MEEGEHKYVADVVAVERRQFEDRAPVCNGDTKISRMAFGLSDRQVGDTSGRYWIHYFHFYLCFA
jgi:hypothetical protein